jgi:hypothetical protein
VQWYIARDGQQHGPLSDAELRLFVDGGHLRPTDLLWRPSFADWRPALQVFPPRPADPPLPAPAPAAPAPQPQPQPAAQPSAVTQPAQQPRPAAMASPAAAAQPTAGAGQPTAQAGPATAQPAARQPQGPIGPAPHAQAQATASPSAARAARPADAAARPVTAGPATGGAPATGGRPAAAGSTPSATATATRTAPAPAIGEPASRFSARMLVLGTLLIGVIGLSIWYIANNKDDLMRMAGIGATRQASGKVPVVKADQAVTAALQKSTPPAPASAKPAAAPPATAAPSPAAPAATSAPAVPTPAAEPPLDTATIDGVLQKRPLWTLMKGSFPEWYEERVKEAARLAAGKKADRDVTKHLVEALVAHRRKNSDLALKASTSRHKAIATAFLDNLQSLSGRSADTCYRFISQGETSPIIVDLINDTSTAGPIEAQVIAIFEAVGEGKAQPVTHERPKKEDYDVLAGQLGKLGWSQADLQMFADPKALSAAAPARVCQMVRDWFKAHVDITDTAVQERLLFETLRPVVAG